MTARKLMQAQDIHQTEAAIRDVVMKNKSEVPPENFAEVAAIEMMRDGLRSKDLNPRYFIPMVHFLYQKYRDYNTIASKIGGKWDENTVQQWVRVSQAWVKEPAIVDFLSERPTSRTLTVTKAYRIISKFQDAYVSLKVIELMAGTGDREIAEILRLYEKNQGLTIRECRDIVLHKSR
jgi:hypothetical protein